MCMIGHIPELIESGIDSFKIEGRMKSAYYTAVTANTYRMAIDRYSEDPAGYKYDPAWLAELESVSHREYCTGFYFSPPPEDAKTVTMPGYVREKSYIGVIESYDPGTRRAVAVQRNKISAGESAEIISPGLPGRQFTVSDLRDESGKPDRLRSAPENALFVPGSVSSRRRRYYQKIELLLSGRCPVPPLRVLFEKSTLRTLKNF